MYIKNIIAITLLLAAYSAKSEYQIRFPVTGVKPLNFYFDKDGFNLSTGLHKDTGTPFNPDGFDKEGFDQQGRGEPVCNNDIEVRYFSSGPSITLKSGILTYVQDYYVQGRRVGYQGYTKFSFEDPTGAIPSYSWTSPFSYTYNFNESNANGYTYYKRGILNNYYADLKYYDNGTIKVRSRGKKYTTFEICAAKLK